MSSTEFVESTLSLAQARALHLFAQGLLLRPRARASRSSVTDAIARMQLLQIDTIHIVARSPYLVLFARIGAYPQAWLDEALASGALFEGWAHEACFAPIADYPLHRDFRSGRAHWSMRNAQRYVESHGAELGQLLQTIRRDGPVKSSSFERPAGAPAGTGGWWGWKPEKRWLEALFAVGELMIARRENFQRVYDLRERVLKNAGLDNTALIPVSSADNVRREFILRTIKSLGICQARWIADYFRLGRQIRDSELAPLLSSGEILRVRVRGWDDPAYVHRDHFDALQRAVRNGLRATHCTLLSPFDPVVWDRVRALELFDFDYRLECYTPAAKRKFGYFVLPILVRGCLVGRLDAKAHRSAGCFEVLSIHLQSPRSVSPGLIDDIAGAIVDCARWHGLARVQIGNGTQPALKRVLSAAVDSRCVAPSHRTQRDSTS